jgi:hypothetical protein
MKKLFGMLTATVMAVSIFGASDASAQSHPVSQVFYDPDVGNIRFEGYTNHDLGYQMYTEVYNDWKSVTTVVNLQRYTTSNGWYFIGTRSAKMDPQDLWYTSFAPYSSHSARQWNTWRWEVKMYSAQTGDEIARFYTGSFIY